MLQVIFQKSKIIPLFYLSYTLNTIYSFQQI